MTFLLPFYVLNLVKKSLIDTFLAAIGANLPTSLNSIIFIYEKHVKNLQKIEKDKVNMRKR